MYRAGGQQKKGFRRIAHILQGKTQQKDPSFEGEKLLGKPKGKDQLRMKRKQELSTHIHTYTYIHLYLQAHMKQTHIYGIYTHNAPHALLMLGLDLSCDIEVDRSLIWFLIDL